MVKTENKGFLCNMTTRKSRCGISVFLTEFFPSTSYKGLGLREAEGKLGVLLQADSKLNSTIPRLHFRLLNSESNGG